MADIMDVSAAAFAVIRDMDIDALHRLDDTEVRPLLPCLVSVADTI